ncbi:MAG: hypothetical protein ACK4E8_00615 [Lacibacter sp.]
MHRIRYHILTICLMQSLYAVAQQPDSIWFDLYTDSLKKGSWNYINVVGRFAGGRVLPISPSQLILRSSAGRVEQGSVWIDWNETADSVTVWVQLQKQPSLQKAVTIWIKKEDRQMDVPASDSLLQQLNERLRRQPRSRRKRTTETSWHLPETSPSQYPLKDVSTGP